MHQKQPPAKIATARSAGAGSATGGSGASAREQQRDRAAANSRRARSARARHVRSAGSCSPAGTKLERERRCCSSACPVGGGPSSNTWPWWPPQRAQWYSVRGRISLKSRFVATRSGIGSKKLGQPVPLSYFVSRLEQRQEARRAHERARALLVVERARAGALGVLLEQHRVAVRRQELLPLGLRLLELLGRVRAPLLGHLVISSPDRARPREQRHDAASAAPASARKPRRLVAWSRSSIMARIRCRSSREVSSHALLQLVHERGTSAARAA